MEIKKSPKADLENKKMLFLEIGLVIALAVSGAALAFNTKPEPEPYAPPKQDVREQEIEMERTVQEQEQQPEQQKAKTQVLADVLTIVSNDTKIETPDLLFSDDASVFEDFEFEVEEVVENIVEEEIFVTAEEMPTFQGGDLSKFRNWVQSHVKYPQIALENGIQGNVVIKFVVEKDGKLSNIQVLQSPDKTLSDAAVQVLQKSPKWKPGKQRNKPVRVTYTLPVSFKIQQ
ncbi:MAG: energy transducer TonB [Alistipes sp.]|jgi:protein TonB|nr:energy transducer TonB [Alistipes sp.]MEE0864066.1 energy transducer TonB [Alistipes sp.]